MKILVCAFIISIICLNCGTTNDLAKANNTAFAFMLEDSWEWCIIDTFKDTFTVDYSTDRVTTIHLTLTAQDLDTIKNEMDKINIYAYPEYFKPGDKRFIDPHSTYYLKIKSGDVIKEIHWDDANYSTEVSAQKLRNLIVKIEAKVKQTPEYKKLPVRNLIHM